MKLKVEMSVEEYEKFLETYFPEVKEMYDFMLNKMCNEFMYPEKDVKNMILDNLVPLINDKLEEISNEKKGD